MASQRAALGGLLVFILPLLKHDSFINAILTAITKLQ